MLIIKRILAAAIIFILPASILAADEQPDPVVLSTVEQIEEIALSKNIDYQTALLDVLQAYNALEPVIKVESSSLNLTGSYTHEATDPLDYGLAVSIPLIEQLSLSGNIDQDMNGNIGININPLSHSGSVPLTKLEYQTQLVYAEETARSVRDTAVENFLEWADASKSYEVLKKTVDVKKTLYDDEKIRMDKGEAVLDDVRDAFTEWSEARTDLNTALNNLQEAEAGLYSTLNIDPADYQIAPPAEADLFTLIEELRTRVDSTEFSISGSWDVLSAGYDTEALAIQLENTWFFEPDFSFGGDIALSSSTQPAVSATVSMSFSPEDFKATDIEELRTELDISRQKISRAESTAELDLKQALTNVETASINYDTAKVELEQAEELLGEAKYLHELGEYSDAELEETELLYQQSVNGLFSAAVERYTALRKLIYYAP